MLVVIFVGVFCLLFHVYFSLSLCVSTFFLWTVLGYFNGVLLLAMQLNDCKVYFLMLIYIYIYRWRLDFGSDH